MNPKRTILYVAKDLSLSNSIIGKLKSSGFKLISANRATEAVAKLFAHRRVEAIVLDQRATEKISLGLARFIKSFHAAVPVILLSTQLVDPLPRCIDAGVCVHDDLGSLVPTIELLLDSPDAAV
jgi:DNA-binding NtrC family response regulator